MQPEKLRLPEPMEQLRAWAPDLIVVAAFDQILKKDVLELPWGFEIYSLLTRWNPLNIRRPFPAKDSGKKVLIVGLGPAGFTLAHYLLNEGHAIAAIVFALQGLYRLRHSTTCFAGTQHQGAALGHFRQVSTHGVQRQSALHCCAIKVR